MMHSIRQRISNGMVLFALLSLMALESASAEELWGVAAGNELMNFSSTNQTDCGRRAISGLAAGESIVGLDFRSGPTGMGLYALADTGQLYLIIDPISGIALPVTPGPAHSLLGTVFGVDFDQVGDGLRVVSNAEQNLRVDPDTGALMMADGNLAYVAGDPNAGKDPGVTACAYAINPDVSSSSTLFAIDSQNDVLVVLENPENGGMETVGSLGVGAHNINGFDISETTGIAYAALVAGAIPEPSLFVINLTTGEATRVGSIACEGGPLRGLTVANVTSSVNPSTWGRIKAQY
jgi:hypothetical protein